ncbi:MAG TPA: HAMP domain-containing sensor histidine kinase [Pirellulales bacterium]
MLWLPALDVDGRPWRLPLASRSAPALAALLVDDACRDAVAAARQALAVDPPLALWTLVRAAQLGSRELKTLDALAVWLARNATRVLRWPEGAAPTPSDRDWNDRYDRLWSQSLAVATRASEFANGAGLADQAFLLGLLHAADDWWKLDEDHRLSVGGPTIRTALPDWLAAAQEEVCQSPHGAQGIASCVHRARQAVFEGGQPSDQQTRSATAGDHALAFALPQLSRSMARLAELRDHFDQRLETEKLEAMAEFAAGAGHEINNPLAVIAGRAQLLIADETNAERRRELAVMNSQAMRVFEMISDMMLFARPPRPLTSRCDLAAVVNEALSDLAGKFAERNTAVQRTGENACLEMVADAVQLAVALRALFDNALNAMGRGGTLIVELQRTSGGGDGREQAVITIRDTGPGISAEARRHLFDPFYSGRRAGRGLGMGLAKCWRIITNHGGIIEVESEAERGATFTLRLPL